MNHLKLVVIFAISIFCSLSLAGCKKRNAESSEVLGDTSTRVPEIVNFTGKKASLLYKLLSGNSTPSDGKKISWTLPDFVIGDKRSRLDHEIICFNEQRCEFRFHKNTIFSKASTWGPACNVEGVECRTYGFMIPRNSVHVSSVYGESKIQFNDPLVIGPFIGSRDFINDKVGLFPLDGFQEGNYKGDATLVVVGRSNDALKRQTAYHAKNFGTINYGSNGADGIDDSNLLIDWGYPVGGNN